ncbi:hypothetical protein [Massilia sp. TSP1-1-2]|uniref:hypothetical protein n=2 Tax=unclassified Massilia TaxID=2609279 RepID=UPI003CED9A97
MLFQIVSTRGKASFGPGFCMTKKKYPIISIFVAVVWAAFFYPAERAPDKAAGLKARSGVPALVDVQSSGKAMPKGPAQGTVALGEK